MATGIPTDSIHEYRVFRDPSGWLSIRDYWEWTEDEERAWEQSFATPAGEDLEDLKADLMKMLEALNRPVLDEKTGLPWQGTKDA